LFDPEGATLGLDPVEYDGLQAFYDHGPAALDLLTEVDAIFVDQDAPQTPDYHADLPEDKAPVGRTLVPGLRPGAEWDSDLPITTSRLSIPVNGAYLVSTMWDAATALGVDLRLGHRVLDVVRDEAGHVDGVRVQHGDRTLAVRARRGVIFGTGGFLFDRDKRRAFLRGPVFGGSSAATCTGDFLDIAARLGVTFGNMGHAWWDQVAIEVALQQQPTIEDIWIPFGDSMVQVNKYGRRVMNEKMVYNERGQVHFHWNAGKREYSNLVLFHIYDDAVAQSPQASKFRGYVPMPGDHADYVVSAETWPDLVRAIQVRLERLEPYTGGVRLDEGFLPALLETIQRFNGYAASGVDAEFNRGTSPIEVAWSAPVRPESKNPCLAPFAGSGPFHCIIVGAGALDTKGGPRVNGSAQVLDTNGQPIPGLYGAGNCIASPLGQGYPGAGATLGVGMTFGYLAGLHAARQPLAEAV
jgi:succinate dehydrogenase/fumarate reductase flavoprotein subunit